MKKFLKRFKGFTLIELLAVIVILAIIAIIAIPIVMNIINESRKNAAVASADGYIRAVNYKIAQEGIAGNIVPLGEYIIGENELDVDAKNKDRITGAYEIGETGVSTAGLCIDKYSIEYSSGKAYYKKEANYCGGEYVFEEPQATFVSVLCEGENADSVYSSTDKYKIKTVEDLVCLSNVVNGGKNFSGKEIYLLSNLDISSSSSYKNSNTTKYGDVNGNGTAEGLLTELTTGAGFKQIGSNSKKFNGTFLGYAYKISNLMINRPSESYVGLFGYNEGTIRGIKLQNISINAASHVGGIAGYNNGTIASVDVNGALTATGSRVGGIAGTIPTNKRIDSVVFSGTVSGTDYVGGILGEGTSGTSSNKSTIKGFVYNTTVTSSGYGGIATGYAVDAFNNMSFRNYNSTKTSTSTNGYQQVGGTITLMQLGGADSVIDTYIGGDNDSDGYYFDYDTNGNITLFSTDRTPIENKLKGEGTQEHPYLIRNYKDWKMATALGTQSKYFSITNDIDFDGKSFYALGTNSNRFNGTINGNMHTLSNVSVGGYDYTGVVGYNNGTIEGIKFNNINLTSNYSYTGITGYNNGTVKGVVAKNLNLTAGKDNYDNSYAGGITGYNNGTITSVDVSGTLTAAGSRIGGIAGAIPTNKRIDSVVFSGTVNGADYAGGLLGEGTSGTASNKSTIKGFVYNTTVTSSVYGGIATGYAVDAFNNMSFRNYNSTKTSTSTTGYQQAGGTITLMQLGGTDGVLDTYIGGDNDSDGYYFDYDSNGNITVYSTVVTPITNTLSGEGTQASPYLINNANDWKVATSLVTQSKYFSITNDIDFEGKNFYAMGTNSNKFNGNINGNMHTLSNISVGGYDYTGVVGYNNGTIEGIKFNNISITSNYAYTGITGYNNGTVKGIVAKNLNLSSGKENFDKSYAGGITGYNNGTITSVDVSGTLTATGSRIGGIAGAIPTNKKIDSVVFSGTVNGADYAGGILGEGTSGTASNKSVIKGFVYNAAITSSVYGGIATGYAVDAFNNMSFKNYNSTKTSTSTTGYQQAGTTIQSITLENINGVIDTTIGGDNDSDGYYFTMTNSNLELVKAN